VLVGALAATLALLAASRRRRRSSSARSGWERATWTMPPIETLAPPAPSRSRTIGLVVMRVYLSVGAVLVVVKVVQLVGR
jgi:hypothetical protein